ncbi:prolyl oligopeptidase family serine peptidase [Candidatus Poribacteria bacterium]|nr:prolyl oligopeptidase family serine peptidase [Candidatus Poribacteria bacterium]
MAKINPPVAKIIPKTITIHGDKNIDNYFWMREKDNPDVIKYLEAENNYTEAAMEHSEELQKKLYDELLGRIKETDYTVPVRLDEYFYYTRTEEGKQYRIYCRKKKSMDAQEEILLDANQLAEGSDYFHLGVYEISPDHKFLAYSVDMKGSEKYTLFIKNLNAGELLSDQIPDTYCSVEWANDNKTIFYNVLDESMRPYKLFRHTLDTDPEDDIMLYHEENEAFYLSIHKSRSKKYIFLELESNNTTEYHFLQADQPDGKFQIIHPRQHQMEYSVCHHDDKFFITTNDNARNFKMIETPVDNPEKDNWKEVIPHREDVKIDDADAFTQHLVIYERKAGLKHIRIRNLESGAEHYIDFPEPVYSFWKGDNPDFNTNIFRFEYTSLATPDSVFDYDMNTRTRELKKQDEVLGGYDPEQYASERIFATASDDSKVPISLVYKKGMPRNGENPLLLYGYGAYGASSDPGFSSNRLSLLDRGFIYAIAHIRGGQEMGRYWYNQGKLLKKKNTFTDFIACGKHLISEKYTSKDKLVIYGGSAGGLLMGAVTNMRPDMFKAVIAKVPFVDVVNTMMDASIPLTVTEYEEWGNPEIRKYYNYIKSYSPYDNIEPKEYPNILVTAGLNDPRVQYWEPAKWTAKLRATKTDDNLLILKTNMGAGHGGASGRYDYLKEIAFEYAFMMYVLGIND